METPSFMELDQAELADNLQQPGENRFDQHQNAALMTGQSELTQAELDGIE